MWILNLADATGSWARWPLRLAKFVNRAEIEPLAADALSRLSRDGADTTLIEDDIPIAVIDATSIFSNENIFHKEQGQAIVYVVENSVNLQEETANAPPSSNFYSNKPRTVFVNRLPPRLRTQMRNTLSTKTDSSSETFPSMAPFTF